MLEGQLLSVAEDGGQARTRVSSGKASGEMESDGRVRSARKTHRDVDDDNDVGCDTDTH